MDFLIQRKTLIDALTRVKASVDSRSTMPILRCVTIVAAGDTVTIEATDLFTHATRSMDSVVRASGTIRVDAKTLLDTLKAQSVDEIRVHVDGTKCVVGTSRSFSRLPIHEDAPPAIPAHADFMTLPARALADVLKFAAPMRSRDASRPNLNCVNVVVEAFSVRAEATNGHCAARSTRRITSDKGSRFAMKGDGVVGALAVARRAAAVGASVTISVGEGWMRIVGERESFASALEAHDFPPFDKVIPKVHVHRIVAPRAALLAACRRQIAMSGSSQTCTTISFGGGAMSIGGKFNEAEEVSDSVDVGGDADGFRFGIDCRYMATACQALGSDYIAIELQSDALGPIIIRPLDGGDDLVCVMPMRLV